MTFAQKTYTKDQYAVMLLVFNKQLKYAEWVSEKDLWIEVEENLVTQENAALLAHKAKDYFRQTVCVTVYYPTILDETAKFCSFYHGD